ncbi:hypothetical protein MASR1M101_26430 [Gemmatimonas sp.]
MGVRIPPPALPRSYEDTLHGERIADPWRWLEDSTRSETQAFLAAQSKYSRAVLTRLVGLDSLERLVADALANAPTLNDVAPAADRIFMTRWLGTAASLVVFDSTSSRERVLWHADSIATLRAGSRLRAITPSWNGRVVAVGLTNAGDQNASLIVLDATTGRPMPDVIPDLLTTTSGTRYQVTWLPDGSGFFYPRLWPGSTKGPAVDKLARGRQFLHRLGTTQSDDVPVFGFDVSPKLAVDREDLPTRIHTAPGSAWLLASLYRVKASGTDWYVAPLRGTLTRTPDWTPLANATDALSAVQLRGDTVYALSHANAERGRIVRRVLG